MEEKGTVKIDNRDSVKISIPEQPKNQVVTVQYHTLNGNTPNKNGNYIALWPLNGGVIPRQTAIWSEIAKKDEPDSKMTYSMPINDDGYIVGYCQTGDPHTDLSAATNVSACAVINPADAAVVQCCAELDLEGASSSAVLSYTLLKNMDYTDHWFGIWEENKIIGVDAPMYADKTANSDPDKSGYISLDSVSFCRGTAYQLAYFVAGYAAGKYDTSKMLAIIEFRF